MDGAAMEKRAAETETLLSLPAFVHPAMIPAVQMSE
jgi:hypothetical protein